MTTRRRLRTNLLPTKRAPSEPTLRPANATAMAGFSTCYDAWADQRPGHSMRTACAAVAISRRMKRSVEDQDRIHLSALSRHAPLLVPRLIELDGLRLDDEILLRASEVLSQTVPFGGAWSAIESLATSKIPTLVAEATWAVAWDERFWHRLEKALQEQTLLMAGPVGQSPLDPRRLQALAYYLAPRIVHDDSSPALAELPSIVLSSCGPLLFELERDLAA